MQRLWSRHRSVKNMTFVMAFAVGVALLLPFDHGDARERMDAGMKRAEAIVGRWNLRVLAAQDVSSSWLEVERSAFRALVGRFVGLIGGARPIGKVDWNNGVARFTIPTEWESPPGDLRFEVRPIGDSLVGRRVTIAVNGTTVIADQIIPGLTGSAIDSDEAAPGPRVLQGEENSVEFRNVTIREPVARTSEFSSASCTDADSAAAVSAVRSRLADWVRQANEGDRDGMREVWAPGLVGWFPRAGVFSDSAALVAAKVRTSPRPPNPRTTFEISIDDIVASGPLVVVHDIWKETKTFSGAANSAVRTIRGSELWRCQPDGRWRIARYVSAPEPWTLAPAPSAVRLDGLTVIDMVDSVPRPMTSILIESGRITGMGSPSSLRSPPGTRVVDLRGLYAIPGLIDAHVHLTAPFERRGQQDSLVAFFFRGGITAIRDMAGDARVLRERALAASADSAASTRIYYSALFAGANFFRTDRRAPSTARGLEPGKVPWARSITSESEAFTAVRDAKSVGATGIKVYAELTASQLAAVTRAAHEQGLKVWSHAAVIPAKPSDGVRAGVDVLSHAFMLMFEDVDSVATTYGAGLRQHVVANHPPGAPTIARVIADMSRRGTMLDPSLYVIQRYAATPEVLTGEMRMMRGVDEWGITVTRLAHKAGVRLVAGTDNSGYPGRNELPTLHDELQIFVERVGLTPFEALVTATKNGAEVLGASNDLGTIAVGKLADLVILEANPLEDIRNTRRIVAVVKAGRVFR
jgi:imidazolonepropionase-like amidohydrolase/ketosteroid isomerase-like protein